MESLTRSDVVGASPLGGLAGDDCRTRIEVYRRRTNLWVRWLTTTFAAGKLSLVTHHYCGALRGPAQRLQATVQQRPSHHYQMAAARLSSTVRGRDHHLLSLDSLSVRGMCGSRTPAGCKDTTMGGAGGSSGRRYRSLRFDRSDKPCETRQPAAPRVRADC